MEAYSQETNVSKRLEILNFFSLLLFFSLAVPASAQLNFIETREFYNGTEYIIERGEDIMYCITNVAYSTLKKQATRELELEGESYEDWQDRRDSIRIEIYNIANKIFDFKNIPIGDLDLSVLSLECFFDCTTKEYVGVYFMFDFEVKDYITLEKINALEKELSQANLIITDSVNLLDRNHKYFSVPMGFFLGEE